MNCNKEAWPSRVVFPRSPHSHERHFYVMECAIMTLSQRDFPSKCSQGRNVFNALSYLQSFLSVTEPSSQSDSVHGILEDIWNKPTKSQVTGPTCSQNLCSTSTNHTWQFTITIHVTAGKTEGFPYIYKALGLVSSTVTNKQTKKTCWSPRSRE